MLYASLRGVKTQLPGKTNHPFVKHIWSVSFGSFMHGRLFLILQLCQGTKQVKNDMILARLSQT